MNKGPDKGKYNSTLMTSAHFFFFFLFRGYWQYLPKLLVMQVVVIHDGCDIKLETLLGVFKKNIFSRIAPPKNTDGSINFIIRKS